ncbi:MAG: DNA gyrase subunit A, partial [Hormoscilla sp. SP12CHS1]|nr:DNA gyrase subunit A [Hormoscilla sp. SP12CHS1]
GPWVLIVTNNGYGKRTPVSQFRLQRRAGKGLIAAKFKSRKSKDELAALRIVNEDDELMMITSRGIIIRQAVKAISIQSRGATGVRVQRLDEDDAIAAVALVPPLAEEAGDLEED